MVTGVNLPAAQLQVAMGLPLHRIRDIRTLYGMAPTGSSEIDFDMIKPETLQLQRNPSPRGMLSPSVLLLRIPMLDSSLRPVHFKSSISAPAPTSGVTSQSVRPVVFTSLLTPNLVISLPMGRTEVNHERI